MHCLKYSFLIFLGACAAPHVDLMAGVRNFDGAWEQMDVQPAVAAQVNTASPNGFGAECGFIASSDTSYDGTYVNRQANHASSSVHEIFIGARKNFLLSEKLQFFLSAGESYASLNTSVDLAYNDNTVSRKTESLSPYAQAGLNLFVGHNYTIGILVRRDFWSEGHNMFEIEPLADSTSGFLTFGYSF